MKQKISQKKCALLPAAGAAGAVFAVWQLYAQRHFRITGHVYRTAKAEGRIRIVSLADLHDHVYGAGNGKLLDAVTQLAPDLIVIPGDYFTYHKNSDDAAVPELGIRTMKTLVKTAPVFYSYGNHESRMLQQAGPQRTAMEEAASRLCASGVHILRNEREEILIRGNPIEIAGFEPDPAYYKKGTAVRLRKGYLEQCIGRSTDPAALQILLAHAPAFIDSYAQAGADVVFSGHTHGGLVRLPGIGSVFSPELSLLPDYDHPVVVRDHTTMYVSKGLGTHTVHLRVFDPAEIVVTDIAPLEAD